MVVFPSFSAVILPFWSIVATCSLEDEKSTLGLLASSGNTIGITWYVVCSCSTMFSSFSSKPVTLLYTFTFILLVILLTDLAVMVAAPWAYC